ncbi:hypothetical protein [Arthrobacter crystallopoietes]|uniref:hypothetical protein n=1 Tax=Crystallibacter crystallopoietes TaxID=37928 RepID=UPI0011115706|nr:hypothetical protein [Arthrobacter crystallopoietes]
MTATATETHTPVLNDPVQVRFTPQGTPLAVRWDGRLWAVAAEPVHWFSRWNWWESDLPAGRGQGSVVEIEFWRVQVRLGSSASPLRTFELRKHPGWEGWHLTRVSDE